MDSKKLIAEAERRPANPQGNPMELNKIRQEYQSDANPVGTVPIPGTAKGMVSAGVEKLTGRNAEVFIDKLGERLGFERMGTRLYDALIAKCEGAGFDANSLARLRRIREHELRHFHLLHEAIEKTGADPTAMTPGADVSAVASSGILQVLTSPQTSVAESLQAILSAELTDRDGWDLLIRLADRMGFDDMAETFGAALAQEESHVRDIRRMVEQVVLADANVA